MIGGIILIKTELYSTREDGVRLERTFSDLDHYIERDGVLFEDAIDPEGSGRVYTETDKEILRRPFREEE